MEILKKKMGVNIKFLTLQTKTEKYLKNTENFGMELKMKLRQLMAVKTVSMVKTS